MAQEDSRLLTYLKESPVDTTSAHEKDTIMANARGSIIGLAVALVVAAILAVVFISLYVIETKSNTRPNTESCSPSLGIQQCSSQSDTRFYRKLAVASDTTVCSDIGANIMRQQGGSAVDSAIATLLCVGAVNPHNSGIGGGFFMTIYDSETNVTETLNAREVAPLNASETMFVDGTVSSEYGGMAIAVPAEIAGMEEAHASYGRLPWKALFVPTIFLCEQGIVVTPPLERAIEINKNFIMESETLRETFFKPDGEPLVEGDIMTLPRLARTLSTIAEEGARAFYDGSLAANIAEDIQDNGGIMTLQDLAGYTADWKEPVSVTLDHGGYTLYGPPPPAGAVIVQYILNILDAYNVPLADTFSSENQALMDHRMVEALKFGFARRSQLGDEEFVDIQHLTELLQKDSYADETRQNISDDSVLDYNEYGAAFDIPDDPGTTHISVYADDGSAVSVTSTINRYFGSKVQGSRTGIIFNNAMNDFSTPNKPDKANVPPSPNNYIVPGKRPMSSLSPTIIQDGRGTVRMVVGASGSTKIISAVTQAIVDNLWRGYNLTHAIDNPKIHDQLIPNTTEHEPLLSTERVRALKAKGHSPHKLSSASVFCVLEAIRNLCNMPDSDDYCIAAVSDRRKGGRTSGY